MATIEYAPCVGCNPSTIKEPPRQRVFMLRASDGPFTADVYCVAPRTGAPPPSYSGTTKVLDQHVLERARPGLVQREPFYAIVDDCRALGTGDAESTAACGCQPVNGRYVVYVVPLNQRHDPMLAPNTHYVQLSSLLVRENNIDATMDRHDQHTRGTAHSHMGLELRSRQEMESELQQARDSRQKLPSTHPAFMEEQLLMTAHGVKEAIARRPGLINGKPYNPDGGVPAPVGRSAVEYQHAGIMENVPGAQPVIDETALQEQLNMAEDILTARTASNTHASLRQRHPLQAANDPLPLGNTLVPSPVPAETFSAPRTQNVKSYQQQKTLRQALATYGHNVSKALLRVARARDYCSWTELMQATIFNGWGRITAVILILIAVLLFIIIAIVRLARN